MSDNNEIDDKLKVHYPAAPGHGGTRPGSGRPPVLKNQIAKAEALAKKLNMAIKMGLDPLADAYPDLMSKAIAIALGTEDGGKPNVTVLLKLLELPLKLVEPDELREESGSDKLIKGVVDRIKKNAGDIYITEQNITTMGSGVNGDGEGVRNRTNSRTVDDSPVRVL